MSGSENNKDIYNIPIEKKATTDTDMFFNIIANPNKMIKQNIIDSEISSSKSNSKKSSCSSITKKSEYQVHLEDTYRVTSNLKISD